MRVVNENMNHRCDKVGCFIQSAPDIQKMTAGCFSGKIRPGDIDAEIEVIVRTTDHKTMQVERKSHFLVIESKRAYEKLKDAQRWTLEGRAKQGSAVIVIYHDEVDGSDIRAMQVWNIPGYQNGSFIRGSLEKFREACSTWYDLIERGAKNVGKAEPLACVC